MILEDYKTALEGITALDIAIEGAQEKEITSQESKENIENNILSVHGGKLNRLGPTTTSFKRYVGSGLLLTSNGFILTAYHNIKGNEDHWKKINEEWQDADEYIQSWTEGVKGRYYVIDQKGNKYPIDTSFWVRCADTDIALIKAVIPVKPEPIRFRIAKEPLKTGDEISLLGMKGERLYDRHGRVILEHNDAVITDKTAENVIGTIYDTFLTDAQGIVAFSGGAFTTPEGAFAGTNNYIFGTKAEETGKAGGTKAENVFNLVKTAAYGLDTILKYACRKS